jgi:hypothetical protein
MGKDKKFDCFVKHVSKVHDISRVILIVEHDAERKNAGQTLRLQYYPVLQSRSRKEPHHFGGAGTVTRNLIF